MASRIRGQDSRALEQGYLPRSPYIAVDELAPYTDAMAIAFSVNMYAPNAWDGVSNPIFRDVANSMGFTPIYIPGGKG